jgi:D-cysteine desulfhydrase
MVDAVTRLARTEALVLDPVYSGKAMAGLIDLAANGAFEPSDTVVFLHTGGTPSLFAYRTAFGEPE